VIFIKTPPENGGVRITPAVGGLGYKNPHYFLYPCG
jgi:hypothetical protein